MPNKPLPARWPAPAKLNLFLHVTGRRADGYHTLQTLFQFLDYGDELSVEITADGTIARAAPLAGVSEDADLTLRAARALQAASGTDKGARIALTKRLPIGGGLGGGSSDAASTLLALNALWGLDWPPAELARLGLGLGADVPVFVHGRAAWAEGVGEILTPAEPAESWYVVLIPPVSVPTARVFGAFALMGRMPECRERKDAQERQLTHFTPAITIRDFLAGGTHNDLEPVVARLYPEVGKTLVWLRRFGAARMSGSGACVFLPVASAEVGRTILAQCPASQASGFVARGVNRHPLHRLLYD
ncbi:MAG: 4-(cytidine 5'-diphospho)-2-C-methyl-D-erythritol kinase [Gammaproteobacteria bacterium]|nr:4-(cytidine 5'-diphospho)-2-C-methyl-D-erythritol kinase [Gammaproteobacteria bacterium]